MCAMCAATGPRLARGRITWLPSRARAQGRKSTATSTSAWKPRQLFDHSSTTRRWVSPRLRNAADPCADGFGAQPGALHPPPLTPGQVEAERREELESQVRARMRRCAGPPSPVAAHAPRPGHPAPQRFFATAASQAALTTPSRRPEEPSPGEAWHTAEDAPAGSGSGRTPARPSCGVGLPPRTPYRTPLRSRGHGVTDMATPGLSPVTQAPATPGVGDGPRTSPGAGPGGWDCRDSAGWRGLDTPDRGPGFGEADTPGLSPVHDQHPSLGSTLHSESESGSGSDSKSSTEATDTESAGERPAVMGGGPASSGAASAQSTSKDPHHAALVGGDSATAQDSASGAISARVRPGEEAEVWKEGEAWPFSAAATVPRPTGSAATMPSTGAGMASLRPSYLPTCAALAASGSGVEGVVDSPLPAVAEADECASHGEDSSTTSEATRTRGTGAASSGADAARGRSRAMRRRGASPHGSSHHSESSTSSGHDSRDVHGPAERQSPHSAASDGAGRGDDESAVPAPEGVRHAKEALHPSQRPNQAVCAPVTGPGAAEGGGGEAVRSPGAENVAAAGGGSASGATSVEGQRSPSRGGRDTPMEYSESDRESVGSPTAQHSADEEGALAVGTVPHGAGAARLAADGICLEPDSVALALASSAGGGSPSIDRGFTSPSGQRLGRTRSRLSSSSSSSHSTASHTPVEPDVTAGAAAAAAGAAAGLLSSVSYSSSSSPSASGHLLASFEGAAGAQPSGAGSWAGAAGGGRPPESPSGRQAGCEGSQTAEGATPGAGCASWDSTAEGSTHGEEPIPTPARAMWTSRAADESASLALLSPLPSEGPGEVTATPPRPRRTVGADDTALLLTARAAASPGDDACQSQATASPFLVSATPGFGGASPERAGEGRESSLGGRSPPRMPGAARASRDGASSAGEAFPACTLAPSHAVPSPLRDATAPGGARGELRFPPDSPDTADGGALRPDELAASRRAPPPTCSGGASAGTRGPAFAAASMSSTWRRRRRGGSPPTEAGAGPYAQADSVRHARTAGTRSWVQAAVHRAAPHSPGEGASLCAPGVSFSYTTVSSRAASTGPRAGSGADSATDWAEDTRYVHLGSALQEAAEVAQMDEETRWAYAKTVTAGDATAARLIRRSPVATAYLRRRVWGSATDGDRLRTRPIAAARGDVGRSLAASWSRRLGASGLSM